MRDGFCGGEFLSVAPWEGVPRVSNFYGITIRMFFDEEVHSGRPHFHAVYGGDEASFDATDLNRLAGKLPLRVERLVRKWARDHRDEVLENWERGRRDQVLEKIEPLK